MQALQSVEFAPEYSEVGTCFGSSSTSLTCSSHFVLKCQTADLSADAEDGSEGDARTKVGLKLVHMCAFWYWLPSFVSQLNNQPAPASSPLIAKHASFSAVRAHIVLSCHIVFSEHVFFESKRCRCLMQALQSVEFAPEHSEVGVFLAAAQRR